MQQNPDNKPTNRSTAIVHFLLILHLVCGVCRRRSQWSLGRKHGTPWADRWCIKVTSPRSHTLNTQTLNQLSESFCFIFTALHTKHLIRHKMNEPIIQSMSNPVKTPKGYQGYWLYLAKMSLLEYGVLFT